VDDAVTKTIYAVSTNPSRPILTGIHIQVNGNQLTFVGTNSYRLSEKSVYAKKVDSTVEECNIPYQTMAEVSRIFTSSDEDIEITLSKNQVQFSQNGIRLISRLIEGKFPDYHQIVPKSNVSRAVLSASDLLMAIKRMSLFARENNNTIKFEFLTDGQGKVVLTSPATELGSGRTELICTIEGDETSISLNSSYLIDFLSVVSGEYIYFDVDTTVGPAVLRPKEKNDYMYLVMPLKGE
jgi:DNA polymerase-3 subunit beta